MRILFVGSGSGGHVYPMYSLLKEAKKRYDVTYLVLAKSFEERLLKDEDVDKIYLSLPTQASYYKKHPLQMKTLVTKMKELEKKMDGFDAVILGGGFITFIVAILAKKKKIPYYLHEQNAILGDANLYSLKYAKALFSCFPNLNVNKKYQKKVFCYGNPRAIEALTYQKKEYHPLPFRILFVAGSLGSMTLLEMMSQVSKHIEDEFIVITGKKYYEETKKMTWGKSTRLLMYTEQLSLYMARASLIIMRAGATSVMEAAYLKIPMLLIPSPYVKHHHQDENAKYFVSIGGAKSVKEKNITEEELLVILRDLKNNPSQLYKMHESLKTFKNLDSSALILKEIEKNDR